MKKKLLIFFKRCPSLSHACQKASVRKNLHIVSGALLRLISDLIKVLYALNETYMIDENIIKLISFTSKNLLIF